MIGNKFSPILVEIEDALLEHEAEMRGKPEYTHEGFRAATKICMSAIMDKIWELQSFEKMPMEDRLNMVQRCGEDFRKFIKTYTDIDTYDLYAATQSQEGAE